MTDVKKCGNPVCNCVPEKGEKFCSAHCEALKGSVEVLCRCGHSSCDEFVDRSEAISDYSGQIDPPR